MGSIISLIFLIRELLCRREYLQTCQAPTEKFNFSANFFWHYNNIVIGPQRNKTTLKHVRLWDTQVTNQWAQPGFPVFRVLLCSEAWLWCRSLLGYIKAGYLVVIRGEVLLSVSALSHHSPQTSNKKNIPNSSASLYPQKTRDMFSLTLLSIRRHFSEIKWKTFLPASLLLVPVLAIARKKEATEERF